MHKFLQTCDRLQIQPTKHYLYAQLTTQKLMHGYEDQVLATYSMSSSKKPPSCVQDSLGTPWGLHQIVEKIGDGEPLGTVFFGRVSIAKRYWECDPELQQKNLITTRILRLRGCEEGLNAGPGVDTFLRYVYIHGTNQEEAIGMPNSHGCLCLSNADMLRLYNAVPLNTLLLIEL